MPNTLPCDSVCARSAPLSGVEGLAAVILAAGFSSRMSGFKPLLTLAGADGERTALETVCSLYRDAGVRRLLVVTGHRAEEVEAEARRLGVATVRNPHPEAGMFSSVCAGLTALPPCTGAFVHPVDIPLVRPLTVRLLIGRVLNILAAKKSFIPTYRGEEGHPPYIPASAFPAIVNWSGSEGLRGALRALLPLTVPVADKLCLFDMDTDAAYAEVRRLTLQQAWLEPEEAEALLAVYDTPERGLLHARSVGKLAAAFAEGLNHNLARREQATPLLPERALSGGLLHDICKGQPHHERAAGGLLRYLGLPSMARLVEDHRDLTLAEGDPISERELVYLADKYVLCHAPVSLETRFGQKLERFAHDPEGVAAIRRRLANAQALASRFQREAGVSPLELAHTVLGETPDETFCGGGM